MLKLKEYAKSILTPVIIGGIVGIIISGNIDYNSLNKPVLSPPSILFPIIWTIIYILMGISYGILKDKKIIDSKTKIIYYSQLIVNALWSIIFFVFKWRLFSFIWIIVLDILIIIMIYEFYKKSKTAGLLQILYIVWSLFATYLNLFIYLLNR